MKKLVLIAVVLFMVVGLCACGSQNYSPILNRDNTPSSIKSEPEPTDGSVLHSVSVSMSVIGGSLEDVKTSTQGVDTWTDVTSQCGISSGSIYFGMNFLTTDKIIQADGTGTKNQYFIRDGVVIGFICSNGVNSNTMSYKETIKGMFTDNGVTDVPLPRLKTMDDICVDYQDDKIREAREWQAENCLLGIVCSKTDITNMPLVVYDLYFIKTDLVSK